MPVNWALALGGESPADSFQAGYDNALKLRKDQAREKALGDYARDPTNPAAVEALAGADPELAIRLREQQRKQLEANQQRTITQSAAGGDAAAMAQLSGLDPDLWLKMNARQRETVKETVDIVGQAALGADTPEKWDAQMRIIGQRHPEALQYVGRFNEREATIAEANQMNALYERSKIHWIVNPQGGRMEAFDASGTPLSSQLATGGAGVAPPQAQAQPTGQGGGFIKRSDALQLQRAAPAKYQQLMADGARIVPDNADDILAQAKAALLKGADPAKVEQRAMQLMGLN